MIVSESTAGDKPKRPQRLLLQSVILVILFLPPPFRAARDGPYLLMKVASGLAVRLPAGSRATTR